MSAELEFAGYVAARWAVLVRSAVLLGCTTAEGEDLVQSTFLRCLTRWERVSSATDMDAYVYQVLVNLLASSRRRRWWGERPTAVLPDATDGEDATEGLVLRDALRSALADLPVEQRQVLVLRYYADLTVEQVAQVLHVAPGTVKSRSSRGLRQLTASPHLDQTSGDARSPR